MKFKSLFDVRLPENMEKASDRIQFNHCNEEFRDMFESNENFRNGMMDIVQVIATKVNREHPEYDYSTEIFCEEVKMGHTPPGYTWHHADECGKIQLVEEEIHRNTPHTGGRSKWGGGAEARRKGKIGD